MWYCKRNKRAIEVLSVLCLLLLGTGSVLAVDDVGLFELEGNALQDAVAPPDDWETLHNGGGSSIVFTGIIADPGLETIFVGGRKDIQDIPDWGWKSDSGGFPDKDDITNAYAAGYIENGDLMIYFGADRFSNKGDAYLAFWFFQEKIGLNDNGTFSGQHTVGDLLVLVNYPQGTNKSPVIDVVEWNPAEADVAKNLKQRLMGVVCSGGGGLACATTNSGDEVSPWPYTPKSGVPNVFPYESLYEGGINLTQLLGGSTPCFGSFLAESRSSEKFTATLKDFVLGDFPVCGIEVAKTCDVIRLTDSNDVTDKFFVVSFSGEVTNTGVGELPIGAVVTVVDDAGTPGDPSDDITIEETLTSPLLSGGSVPFSGEFFSNENPPFNTVEAEIVFSGSIITAEPNSIECEPLVLDPNLILSKICWTELTTVEDTLLAVEVFFEGEVCNTGDVPLTVTVTDDVIGIVLEDELILPGQCRTVEGSYFPTEANGGETDPCAAMFSDTLTVVGTSPIPGVEGQRVDRTANCPLCGCD